MKQEPYVAVRSLAGYVHLAMAYHKLTAHFARFFARLNPSSSFVSQAASQHGAIRDLIENPYGRAARLRPTTFLQGSYQQDTAIHTINDVDIVVLCRELSIGSGQGSSSRTYSRNEIFDIVAAPLREHWQYVDKIRYGPTSMCIKVDLGIKVEILPVVFNAGVSNPYYEPFALYRPQRHAWENGFARYHQTFLTQKNASAHGNFKPMVKILKHLRSINSVRAVSFHVECLLYHVSDDAFAGGPTDYIPTVLHQITGTAAAARYQTQLMTPCGDRDVFTADEWGLLDWEWFHAYCKVWTLQAELANLHSDRGNAIANWKELLGTDYFPAEAG